MQASTSKLPTPQSSLRLARSTGSFEPDTPGLSPHVGDSSGEQSIDTPSPPHVTRQRGRKGSDSPSPAIRLRTQSNELLSAGKRRGRGGDTISLPQSARTVPIDSFWPSAQPKKRRIRVNSASTSGTSLRNTPQFFPYRNASTLLDADAAWSSAGGSDGVRDDDSSDDVDLDLTLAWEERQAHVGIDMTGEGLQPQLAAPAVIRSSRSFDRGSGHLDYEAGWSFRPTSPNADVDGAGIAAAESSEGRNRQHSWHGLLLGALKTPGTWSTSGSSGLASRRGSHVASSWGRNTTAATTPQSPFFSPHSPKPPDSAGLRSGMEEQQQQPPRHSSDVPVPSLPVRLISAFRDSFPPLHLQHPSSHQGVDASSDEVAGLGIRFGSVPSSPLPEVNISSPEGRISPAPAGHVRWGASPAKTPRSFKPKQLILAPKARTHSVEDHSFSGYRPMRLSGSVNSYVATSPQSPYLASMHGSPASPTPSSDRSFSPQPLCARVELPWYEERSPAELLFLAGWVLGPWCWLLGVFMVRRIDGEFNGSRGSICRCRYECLCHAKTRRRLRLAGIRDSGMGVDVDAQASHGRVQWYDEQDAVDGWVKANRAALGVSSVVTAALFAVALQALIKAW